MLLRRTDLGSGRGSSADRQQCHRQRERDRNNGSTDAHAHWLPGATKPVQFTNWRVARVSSLISVNGAASVRADNFRPGDDLPTRTQRPE
jgi:hypothetical protein